MALLSPAEIAKKHGFSSSQIRRLIRAGVIKAKKVGFFYIVDESDIKYLVRQRRVARKKEAADDGKC